MKLYTGLSKTIMSAAWLSMPFIAFSQAQHLSLKHGIYVDAKTPCKGAPNAVILSWDGIGFSGAHSSKCASRVLRQDRGRFQVSTTCAAVGDGTQNPAGPDYTDSFLLTRLSSTRFEISKENQDKRAYRWCSAKDVD